MKELYSRKVTVEIIPVSGLGKIIDQLRVKFRIEKTNVGQPNDAQIEIYNLSDQTRGLFEQPGTRVRVSIGYLGLNPDGVLGSGFYSSASVETVFIGDINKAKHEKKGIGASVQQKIEGPDIVTTISAKDGENRYRNARLDKGYPPNSKLTAVFDDLIKAMGLSAGAKKGIPEKKWANGLALSGLARDHLNELCRANGLEWSIQDETVQIVAKTSGTPDTPLLISADSGLIGIPSKTDKGVEFTCLILPKLKPGRIVQVDSRVIKGAYKIRRVIHDGDSWQGDFLSKVEATL